MSPNPRPGARPGPRAEEPLATRTTRTTRRTRWATALAVLALSVAALSPTAAEAAEVVEPPRPAFYEAPATLPATNGAVIRTAPQPFVLDVADVASKVKDARRILYRTTNRTGTPIAVSGTVLVPKAPWVGLGRRPVSGTPPARRAWLTAARRPARSPRASSTSGSASPACWHAATRSR